MDNIDMLPLVHCETGTVRNLLHLVGYEDISEAMIFGVGEGLIFSFSKWRLFNGIGFIACRRWQGTIMKNFLKKTKIPYEYKRYLPFMRKKAMRDMDALLSKGAPVGVLTAVHTLPFLTESQQFFFNGHSVLVFHKQGCTYSVVDNFAPCEKVKYIDYEDLARSRFNFRIPCIYGHIYYLKGKSCLTVQWKELLLKSIHRTSRRMCYNMFPFIGTQGIRGFAEEVRTRAAKEATTGERKYFINVYRMLEVGSGGSGYRYLYADFLEESAAILSADEISKAGQELRSAADLWRQVAICSGHIGTGRERNFSEELMRMSSCLLEIASKEEAVFERLYKYTTNALLRLKN